MLAKRRTFAKLHKALKLRSKRKKGHRLHLLSFGQRSSLVRGYSTNAPVSKTTEVGKRFFDDMSGLKKE